LVLANKTEQSKTEQPQSQLPDDPDEAIKAMLSAIDHLCVIYAKETYALDEADNETFFQLQNNKLEAANHYQSLVSQFIDRSQEIKQGASRDNLQALRDKRSEMNEASEANMHALERANQSMQRLSERIINTARREISRQKARYSASGTMENRDNEPISVSITQKV
jgi:hypothetical protein